MRSTYVTSVAAALAVLGGCHRQPSPATDSSGSERTVFTDSSMHARLCQPVAPGEDWHRVCRPLDQSVQPVRPKVFPPIR